MAKTVRQNYLHPIDHGPSLADETRPTDQRQVGRKSDNLYDDLITPLFHPYNSITGEG